MVRRYVVLLHKVQMLIHEILELVVVDVYIHKILRNINTSGKVCSVRFCVLVGTCIVLVISLINLYLFDKFNLV